MRYCVDCEHFRPCFSYGFSQVDAERFGKCARVDESGGIYISPRTGGETYATTARKHNSLCGPDGRLFEQKKPVAPRWWQFWREA